MVSKSKPVNRILTSTQKRLALASLLGLMVLGQGCSGQTTKSAETPAKAKSDDRNAIPEESQSKTAKSSDKDYGSSDDSKKADAGTSGTLPTLPEEETPTVPQPITGSPSDNKMKEEGQLLGNGFYRFHNYFTKKCLVVHQQRNDAGVQIVQGPCDDPTAIFALMFVDHRYYVLQNRKSKNAVQIRGQLAASEALVEQGDYKARDYQKWTIVKEPDGTFLIKPALNEKLCLDVAWGSKDDNANIQLWRECTATGEKWILEEVD